MTKTIRRNHINVACESAIMELNPNLTKPGDVYRFSAHELATDIITDQSKIDLNNVSKISCPKSVNDGDNSETRLITVDDEDVNIIVDYYLKMPNVHRAQFAHVMRLALLYTWDKLNKADLEEESPTPKIIKIDGVKLLRNVAELLEEDTDESKKKIVRIQRIIEGED
ncbi:MAG: hypothetical protein K6B14_09465 [Lachnospiraceae bacterium]|nr:hypothetical protein [Lachnospiraceae bacterium]